MRTVPDASKIASHGGDAASSFDFVACSSPVKALLKIRTASAGHSLGSVAIQAFEVRGRERPSVVRGWNRWLR
jgi:hypothetical protein